MRQVTECGDSNAGGIISQWTTIRGGDTKSTIIPEWQERYNFTPFVYPFSLRQIIENDNTKADDII